MTAPVTGRAATMQASAAPEHERLRGVARDLEGVFVEQLFKAMRETVPDGGVVDGGTGEEMFTTLLDQKMSALAPAKWERGLAQALYEQLRGRVGDDATAAVGGSGDERAGGATVEGVKPEGRGDAASGSASDLRLPASGSPLPTPGFSPRSPAPIISPYESTRPEHS